MIISPISISNRQNNIGGLSFKSSALLSDKKIPAYKQLDVNSADYIKYIYQTLKKVCNDVVEINVETGILQEIVHSNEPYIFIMNHTNQQYKDINAAKFFNTLLYREYIYQSKAENCPRSRILANTGILKRTRDGEKLQWMGAVPINAGLGAKDTKNENALTIKKITNSLIEGKINFFIFPEGALAALTFLPLKYKFQPGVSAIVKKVLEVREHIKVIPLCFAHNKKESAIHIGNPVVFTKENGNYYADRGNINSQYFDKHLGRMYGTNEKLLLTQKGIPAKYNQVVPLISGILMKNMLCCIKEAKKDLKQSSGVIYKL